VTASKSKDNPDEKYGYFLGCVMPAKMPWAEKATFLVAEKLGINWDYMKETLCCVRPGVWKAIDPDTWLTLTAQNLALAEKQGVTLVDSCNGCWITHYEALNELLEEPEKMEMVNKHLAKAKMKLKGTVQVKHFLQVLYEDVGLNDIKKAVKKPLKLRMMRHIGCHARKLGNDVLPKYFDEILEAVGVELVDTPYDSMCCGLLFYFADPKTAIYRNVFKKFKLAQDLGVDAIAIICSGCYDQFDRGIKILEDEGDPTGQLPQGFDIPIVHLSEILALAFGYKPEEFGMDVFRTTSPSKLIAKIKGGK
jgi:heterodisulfide reductase subunit B